MKLTFSIIAVIVAGMLITSCKKNDSSSSSTSSPILQQGNYSATGTISLTAAGTNFSLPISKIQVVTTDVNQLLITASGNVGDALTPTSITITVSSTTGAITTGTFSVPTTSADAGSGVSYLPPFSTYGAGPTVSGGGSATINITKFTVLNITGTFTATVELISGAQGAVSSISITNGVINCNVGSVQ